MGCPWALARVATLVRALVAVAWLRMACWFGLVRVRVWRFVSAACVAARATVCAVKAPSPPSMSLVPLRRSASNAKRDSLIALARREFSMCSPTSQLSAASAMPKVLVLDLDETLVHSTVRPGRIAADFTVPIMMNGQAVTFFVHKRPHVDAFLERVSQWFVVCVWTASLAAYAAPVLDRLDGRGIVHRRMFRDSCVMERGLYLKDLAVQGFPLENTIIVDNSPLSFKTCPANGFPIESWFDDQHDEELLHLLPLLDALRRVDDVRPILRYSACQ